MKASLGTLLLITATALTGCAETAQTSARTTDAPPADAALGEPSASPEVAMQAEADGTAVTLSPENTTLQFVGLHANPEKPDPRTGEFTQFAGTAIVDENSLASVEVEIETASVTTEIEKLTNHLKSPDFFNVNEHPKARFVSTSIQNSGSGNVEITGDLTLLDETHSITFPATVNTENGLTLDAEFEIDRTQFGMDYGMENVEKNVKMTISVES
jgi:polyisoprenoid-binding protein YceI